MFDVLTFDSARVVQTLTDVADQLGLDTLAGAGKGVTYLTVAFATLLWLWRRLPERKLSVVGERVLKALDGEVLWEWEEDKKGLDGSLTAGSVTVEYTGGKVTRKGGKACYRGGKLKFLHAEGKDCLAHATRDLSRIDARARAAIDAWLESERKRDEEATAAAVLPAPVEVRPYSPTLPLAGGLKGGLNVPAARLEVVNTNDAAALNISRDEIEMVLNVRQAQQKMAGKNSKPKVG